MGVNLADSSTRSWLKTWLFLGSAYSCINYTHVHTRHICISSTTALVPVLVSHGVFKENRILARCVVMTYVCTQVSLHAVVVRPPTVTATALSTSVIDSYTPSVVNGLVDLDPLGDRYEHNGVHLTSESALHDVLSLPILIFLISFSCFTYMYIVLSTATPSAQFMSQ